MMVTRKGGGKWRVEGAKYILMEGGLTSGGGQTTKHTEHVS